MTIATGSFVEVVVVERAPLEHFLAHHIEKGARDLLEIDVRPIAILFVLLAFDFDRPVAREDHAEPVGERGRLEVGVVAELAHQSVVEQLLRLRRRIVALHQPHAGRHDAARVVAVVDALLVEEGAHLQQRADQQDTGDDDLEDDQAARDEVDAAAGVAAPAVAQHLDDVGARRHPRRQQRPTRRRAEGGHDRHREHARVDVERDPRRRRRVEIAHRRREPVDRQVREADAERGADAGDEQALR